MKSDLSLQSALASLLTFAAVVLLCVVLARWFWLWFAPLPEVPAPVSTQSADTVQTAYQLFGAAPIGNLSTATLTPAATGLAIRLLGIIAAQGEGKDYAVVELAPGTIMAIHEGQEFAPGVRLAEVNPRELIIERSGIRETLAWPQPLTN